MLIGLRFSAREQDEVGYCRFCCRQLYYTDVKFCDKACESRKRQLGWKSATHLGKTCFSKTKTLSKFKAIIF